MYSFDAVLDKVGTFGLYQMLVIAGLSYSGIPFGLNAIGSVFLAYAPEYRCSMYPFDDSNLYPNLTNEEISNITTPLDEYGDPIDACRKYDYNVSDCSGVDDFSCVNKSATMIECSDYIYDDDLFTNTVVTEFNMVCDRNYLNTVSSSSYMVGMLVGSILFGNIADRFGRKVALVSTTYGLLLSMVGVAYSNSVILYLITRFLVAIFAIGSSISLFCHMMEVVGYNYRSFAGIGSKSMFAVGYMLWSGIAYVYKDWHQMQLGALVVSAPFAIIVLIIPESPRWLFTTGRDKQGKKVTSYMAKLNRVELEESFWNEAGIYAKETQGERDESKKYSTIDLFRHRGSRIYTLKLAFNWAVNSMVYYGTSLNAGSLAGNIYLNNIYAGILEIASYIFCIIFMDRVGRRLLLTITLTGAGVSLLICTIFNIYAGDDLGLITAGVVFAFLAKALVSASFAVVYNFTSELFPTVVRTNAIGFGSMCARIGGVLAPLILELKNSVFWLPNTIFGVIAIVGGLSSLTLRDTTGREMMETLEEAELFYARKEPTINHKIEDEKMNEAIYENKAMNHIRFSETQC